MNNLAINKQKLVDEINRRVGDKILEKSNADLLIKLMALSQQMVDF